MSTITSNASCNPSSISVTGKKNGSGTISWSLPTVPAGWAIKSCKLTGTCTISDSSGKPATVKVNGTSVSSGVAFTINLGTGNTTTSVAVAATGPHKNTKSTITFSNLVYTVDYETSVSYTVTFKDWDGTVLKTETVKEGSSATAPSDPTRDGYKFTGWDVSFNNVTSDLIVTAQYEEVIRHLVARYTANTSGVVPTFNDNYDRIINETETNGIYTVEIHSSEDFSKCIFGGISSILSIEYLKITSNVTDMTDMFYNCTSLKQINTTEWDTSNVIKMRNTFQKCTSLTSLDVSLFDVSNVTHMDYMFDNCTLLTSVGDLSKWSANNLINTSSMFSYCDRLTSINLSNLKPNALEYIGFMFADCRRLSRLDLSNLDLNTAISTYNLFTNDYDLIYVNMQNSDYTSVNKIIGALISCTLNEPGVLNIKGIDDITQVDVTTAESKYWNIVGVGPYLVAKYTADTAGVVPTFNSGYVYELTETENNGIYTVEITSDNDFSSINFKNKNDLLTVEYLKITNAVTNTSYMFYGCSWLASVNGMADWDMSNVTNASYMFEETNITDFKDIVNWNTNKMQNIRNMFYNSGYLESIDLRGFNTNNITNMFCLFQNSYKLKSANLDDFVTSNTTNINNMFYYCKRLETLSLNNWDLNGVTTISYFLYFTEMLTNISMKNSDYNSVNKIITQLPTRTSDSMGTLNIEGVDDFNQVDIVTAQSKFWNVVNGEPEEPEEPDNNELIQGDINDETGVYEDEVPNVVKTKYIDISDKKQILVNVLTEDVYVLKCYLYNANKELVKIIDISADKKRMFGLDLQKLIEEVMNDGNE